MKLTYFLISILALSSYAQAEIEYESDGVVLNHFEEKNIELSADLKSLQNSSPQDKSES